LRAVRFKLGPPNAPVALTAIPGSLVAVTRDIPLMSRVANQRRPLDHGGAFPSWVIDACIRGLSDKAITHMMVI
jgi:hypothetical protein